MKVIFLDIDGVLNSRSSIKDNHEKGIPVSKTTDPHIIHVSLLNSILKETGAKIVLSATKRILLTEEEVKKYLKDYGVECECIGCTPIHRDRYRGREILQYLHDHPEIDIYIVIDDGFADLDCIKDRLVRTNNIYGLTETEARKAIELLNS